MNFRDLLIERLTGRQPVAAGPPRKVIGPAALTVAPPPRFAWDEKRWHRIEDGATIHYVGPYRVRQRGGSGWRDFAGRIVQDASGIKAYVADPPPEIKSHPKGPCFQMVRAPWFRVHWRRTPATIDEALLYVERLLDECLNGTRGRR